MPILKQARFDFKETFELEDIRAYAYDEEKVRPPCILIYPHQRYWRNRSSTNGPKTFNTWTIGLNLVVIGTKGTRPQNSDDLDELIERVVKILEPKLGVTLGEVSGPGQLQLFNGEYFGCTMEVEYDKNAL